MQIVTSQCNQGDRRQLLLCKGRAVERGLDSLPGSTARRNFSARGHLPRVSVNVTITAVEGNEGIVHCVISE